MPTKAELEKALEESQKALANAERREKRLREKVEELEAEAKAVVVPASNTY